MSVIEVTAKPICTMILDLAQEYSLISENQKIKSDGSDSTLPIVPGIVNQSFALELLLKFFYFAQYPECITYSDFKKAKRVPVRGHTFIDLYDKLKPETKIFLKSEYKKEFSRDLYQDLKSLGNPFMEWRYIYEKETLQHSVYIGQEVINFLGVLAHKKFNEIYPFAQKKME